MRYSLHRSLMTCLQRLKSSQDGATIIEVAFTLPVLLWLIMAILEFGIIFHLMSLTNYAATEAARLGKTGALYGVSSRDQLISDTISGTLEPWLRGSTMLTIETRSLGSFNDPGVDGIGQGGELVHYSVTLNWPLLTPMISNFFEGGTVPIRASVLVKNEEF